jgi:hypothetical protein
MWTTNAVSNSLYGVGSTFIRADDSDAVGVAGALVVARGAGSMTTVAGGRSLFEAHATSTKKIARLTTPS